MIAFPSHKTLACSNRRTHWSTGAMSPKGYLVEDFLELRTIWNFGCIDQCNLGNGSLIDRHYCTLGGFGTSPLSRTAQWRFLPSNLQFCLHFLQRKLFHSCRNIRYWTWLFRSRQCGMSWPLRFCLIACLLSCEFRLLIFLLPSFHLSGNRWCMSFRSFPPSCKFYRLFWSSAWFYVYSWHVSKEQENLNIFFSIRRDKFPWLLQAFSFCIWSSNFIFRLSWVQDLKFALGISSCNISFNFL